MRRIGQSVANLLILAVIFLSGMIWFALSLPPAQLVDGMLFGSQPRERVAYTAPSSVTMKFLRDMRRSLAHAAFDRAAPPGAVTTVSVVDGDPFEVGAERTETLRIPLLADCASTVHVMTPQGGATDMLLIYHQGHNGHWRTGASLVSAALSQGFTVAAFQMPFLADNACRIDHRHPTLGDISIDTHPDFFFFKDVKAQLGVDPLYFFLAAVRMTLDHLTEAHAFSTVAMAGHSGGGWTTTVYAALDERINTAVSIAGDTPFSVRGGIPGLVSDFEEWEIAEYGDYFHLYLLAMLSEDGFTRRKYNFYNSHDPCCFSASDFDPGSIQTAVNDAKRRLSEDTAQGTFEVRVFENAQHALTPEIVDAVMAAIQ